jgi:hypothetical protein
VKILTCSKYFKKDDGSELRVETYNGPLVTIAFDAEGKVSRILVDRRKTREIGIDYRTYLGVYRVGRGPGG